MKKARASLKDILREEQASGIEQAETVADPSLGRETSGLILDDSKVSKKSDTQSTKAGKRNNISEKVFSKSEYVKMSVTIEPDLFEAVDELSRTRRRLKQEYSISGIVRDALKEYIRKKIS